MRSIQSDQGFRNASAILNTTDPIGEHTRLIPLDALERTLERIEIEPDQTHIDDARNIVNILVHQNPNPKVNNPTIFANTLIALVCSYPPSISLQSCDPVNGLIANLDYDLKPSDLKKFLDKRKAERETVRLNALRMKAERANRTKLSARERQIEAERAACSQEERERRAELIRKGVRLPPLLDGVSV